MFTVAAGPIPRMQIVTVEEAMRLRDRAARLTPLRADTFKKAGKDEDTTRQKALDL
jgi:hypothetical protein